MKPRFLYYRVLKYQPSNLELLCSKFTVSELDDPRADSPDFLADVEVLSAPLGFRVDAQKMNHCPKLRVIVSNTTGIPHIDVAAAQARGIVICALHDESEFLSQITPTAEHAIGLMLAAWRRIPAAHAAAAAGRWDRRPWGAPRMLSRMRLGLLGYGRLGRRVASIASAMGMVVRYYDPYVAGGMESVLDLARMSDVLSLHATATEETRNIVSRSVLAALPSGSLVVNTARGELLDLDALIDFLESGHVWAAALDTIDGEYDPGFSDRFERSRAAQYARTRDNLILTPHIGGSTVDAWYETERLVLLKACKALGLGSAER